MTNEDSDSSLPCHYGPERIRDWKPRNIQNHVCKKKHADPTPKSNAGTQAVPPAQQQLKAAPQADRTAAPKLNARTHPDADAVHKLKQVLDSQPARSLSHPRSGPIRSQLKSIIDNSENNGVLKKFVLFVILILLSPVVLIVLYRYWFLLLWRVARSDALQYSMYMTVVYIVLLMATYAFLAYKEEVVDFKKLSMQDNKLE